MSIFYKRSFIVRKDSQPEKSASSLDLIRMLALVMVMLKAGLPFHRAMISARCFAKGTFIQFMDRALRKTVLGGSSSLEQAIEEESKALPLKLKWASRALKEFITAAEEPNDQTKETILDRIFSTALNSCRQSLKESLGGLRIPVTTIFALGIVLPIVIATMLPLWNLVSPGGLSQEFSVAPDLLENSNSETSLVFNFATISILLFPFICVYCTHYLLRNRVSISSLDIPYLTHHIVIFFALFGGFFFLIVHLLELRISFWILVLVALFFVVIIDLRWKRCSSRSSINAESLNNSSAFNLISYRLTIGEHFARAAALTNRESSDAKDFLWASMQPRIVSKNDNRPQGAEMLSLISEASDKNPQLAAQMLRHLARHFNDLSSIEFESRIELKPITQSVSAATIFLSPFVLGLLSGFDYLGLFAADQNQSFQMLESLFLVFIVEMSIVGLWFNEYIGFSKDFNKKNIMKLSIAVAISIIVFLISRSFSTALFS